ncbi:MAG: hypothetical protein EB824_05960, partial [Thaumarchaeota archaeon S15]
VDAERMARDTVPPRFTRAAFTDASTIELTFSEALEPAPAGVAANYMVSVPGPQGSVMLASAAYTAGQTSVTLTLSSPATAGAVHTVTLARILSDANGVLFAEGARQTAAYQPPGATVPTFTAATTSVTTVALTFPIPVSGPTAPGDWSIDGSETPASVSQTTLTSASTLTLTYGEKGTGATPVVRYTGSGLASGVPTALSGAAVLATDGVAPAPSVHFADDHTLSVYFGEEMGGTGRIASLAYGISAADGTYEETTDGSPDSPTRADSVYFVGANRLDIVLAVEAPLGVDHAVTLPSGLADLAGNSVTALSYTAAVPFTARTSSSTTTVVTFASPPSGTLAVAQWSVLDDHDGDARDGGSEDSTPDVPRTVTSAEIGQTRVVRLELSVLNQGELTADLPGGLTATEMTLVHEAVATDSEPRILYAPARPGAPGSAAPAVSLGGHLAGSPEHEALAADGAPPEFGAVRVGETETEIVFSEAVRGEHVAAHWRVDAVAVTSVRTPSGEPLTLVHEPLDTARTPLVTHTVPASGALVDISAAENAIGAAGDVVSARSTDEAAPVARAYFVGGAEIQVAFGEALAGTGAEVAGAAYAVTRPGASPGDAAVSVALSGTKSYDAASRTLRIGLAGEAAPNILHTIVIPDGALTDARGNLVLDDPVARSGLPRGSEFSAFTADATTTRVTFADGRPVGTPTPGAWAVREGASDRDVTSVTPFGAGSSGTSLVLVHAALESTGSRPIVLYDAAPGDLRIGGTPVPSDIDTADDFAPPVIRMAA